MPISSKDIIKLFKKAGYKVIPSAGKGSHHKLKKANSPTVTVPNHKELAKGTEKALLNILHKVQS